MKNNQLIISLHCPNCDHNFYTSINNSINIDKTFSEEEVKLAKEKFMEKINASKISKEDKDKVSEWCKSEEVIFDLESVDNYAANVLSEFTNQ